MKKKKNKLRLIIGGLLLIAIVVYSWYAFKDIKDIIEILYKGDIDYFQAYMDGIKFESVTFIIVVQIFQLLFVVFPAEIIEIASSLSFGWFFGAVVCMGGILVGSSIIFLLVKVFKFSLAPNVQSKIAQSSSEKGNKGLIPFIFALYLSPIIPYGAISYYFASRKVSYLKYIIVTFFAAIPSVLFATTTANIVLRLIVMNSFIVLAIFIVGIIVFSILFSYVRMLKRPLKSLTARKPSFLLYYFLMPILYIYFKIKNNIHIDNRDIKGLKGPFVMVCNHPSKPDFVYACCCVKNRRVRVVANRYYFYNNKVRYLLEKLGAIPKNLFDHDLQTIKMVMQSIKDNGVVLIMPEGRLSASGKMEKITEGTAKLLKKLDVPVVSINVSGAYYTGAKWAKNRRRGRIDIKASRLFNKGECQNLEVEEIYQKLNEALYYNDKEYLEKNNVTYKCKDFTKNLDAILFICPECKQEFTLEAANNHITCDNCGLELELNNRYQFITSDKELYKISSIPDWYQFQVDSLRMQIIENENYQLSDNVNLKTAYDKNHKIHIRGSGVCTLTKTGLKYQGTHNGETCELFFKADTIPAIPFDAKKSFEVYRGENYYAFEPFENPCLAVKYSIVGEIIYSINKEK